MVDRLQSTDLVVGQLGKHLGDVSGRVVNAARLRKLGAVDAEPGEDVAAVLGQGLVVPDEVEVQTARLTELVERLPVTVERPASSRVDDVPNKLTERQWTAVFRRAVLASDVGGDSPKVRVVSAKKNKQRSHCGAVLR